MAPTPGLKVSVVLNSKADGTPLPELCGRAQVPTIYSTFTGAHSKCFMFQGGDRVPLLKICSTNTEAHSKSVKKLWSISA